MTSDHKSIINNRSLNAFCCSSFHDLATHVSIHLVHRPIHFSIQCRCMIVIRILSFFFFFFLSFFHSSKTFSPPEYYASRRKQKKKRKRKKTFLPGWNVSSISLFLFISLSFVYRQRHPRWTSCAQFVILSKLGRFRFRNESRSHNAPPGHGLVPLDSRRSLPNFDRKLTRERRSTLFFVRR